MPIAAWVLGSVKLQCAENHVVRVPQALVASKTEVHNSQLLILVPRPQAPRNTGMCCVCCMALVSAGDGLSVCAATSLLISRATGVAVY